MSHCDQPVEYKGYTIFPVPSRGADGKWYSGYRLDKGGAAFNARDNIFPGFLYYESACADSVEHAKIQIDAWENKVAP
jgi:hypothetical protein